MRDSATAMTAAFASAPMYCASAVAVATPRTPQPQCRASSRLRTTLARLIVSCTSSTKPVRLMPGMGTPAPVA